MASYIDQNLAPGETVIHRTRIHRIIYAWPVFWLFAAVVLLSSDGGPAGGILLLVGILTLINAFFARLTTELAITNKRTIHKTGLVWRKTNELLLSKVESINVDQGVIGRILNYGTITVSGTGGAKSPFKRIAAPMDFRRHAYEQLGLAQDGGHLQVAAG